jgi:hypothetical protein
LLGKGGDEKIKPNFDRFKDKDKEKFGFDTFSTVPLARFCFLNTTIS